MTDHARLAPLDTTINSGAAIDDLARSLKLGLWCGGALALAATAVLLLERQWVGAIRRLPPPGAMFIAGTIVASIAIGLAFGAPEALSRSSRRSWVVRGALAAALLAIAVALTPPAAAWSSYIGLVLPLAATVAVLIGSARADQRRERSTWPSAPLEQLPAIFEAPAADGSIRFRQQLDRQATADGVDELNGAVLASMAEGEQTVTVHIAFCPPFARVPILTHAIEEGPDARVKVVQLLPHGVRFDIRRVEPATTPAELLLSFTARCTEQEQAA